MGLIKLSFYPVLIEIEVCNLFIDTWKCYVHHFLQNGLLTNLKSFFIFYFITYYAIRYDICFVIMNIIVTLTFTLIAR